MLRESEIKEMIVTIELKQNIEFEFLSYLIQNIDDYNFVIHRGLEENEIKYYKNKEIYEYQGKHYLHCISNCPSEENAELAIKSYWKAIKQLKTI